MEGIGGIIVILFLIVSAISRTQKVKNKDDKRQSGKNRAPHPTDEPSPSLPAEVALPPRQATAPTRWESEEGTSDWLTGPEIQAYMKAEEAMAQITHRPERIIKNRDHVLELEPTPQDEAMPVVIPGLNLQLNADSLVKGVIFSEILTRRPQRRHP